MRKAHRWIAVFAVLIGMYISLTGLAVQSMDLAALIRHAPASDPTMQAMREGIDGPPNFRVIRDQDYAAPALPRGFNYDAALATLLAARHQKLGAAPVSFVELRMTERGPIGNLLSNGSIYSFDPASGEPIGTPTPHKLLPLSTPSLRGTIKSIHRMRYYGTWGVAVNAVTGLVMVAIMLTGLLLYLELYRARARMKRKTVYWFGGDWWRTLHRGIAATSVVFLLWIAVTGTILAISSMGVAAYVTRYGPQRPGITVDVSRPLADSELPGMLHTTLRAFRIGNENEPIKAIRLRYFAGMPQGVVVGGDRQTTQFAYNASTGRWASFHEPGYPVTGQTFGWQVDETVKELHRGDYFGLTGRWISLLCGFSMLYLAVSGAVMYFDLWNRRRKKNKKELFW